MTRLCGIGKGSNGTRSRCSPSLRMTVFRGTITLLRGRFATWRFSAKSPARSARKAPATTFVCLVSRKPAVSSENPFSDSSCLNPQALTSIGNGAEPIQTGLPIRGRKIKRVAHRYAYFAFLCGFSLRVRDEKHRNAVRKGGCFSN